MAWVREAIDEVKFNNEIIEVKEGEGYLVVIEKGEGKVHVAELPPSASVITLDTVKALKEVKVELYGENEGEDMSGITNLSLLQVEVNQVDGKVVFYCVVQFTQLNTTFTRLLSYYYNSNTNSLDKGKLFTTQTHFPDLLLSSSSSSLFSAGSQVCFSFSLSFLISHSVIGIKYYQTKGVIRVWNKRTGELQNTICNGQNQAKNTSFVSLEKIGVEVSSMISVEGVVCVGDIKGVLRVYKNGEVCFPSSGIKCGAISGANIPITSLLKHKSFLLAARQDKVYVYRWVEVTTPLKNALGRSEPSLIALYQINPDFPSSILSLTQSQSHFITGHIDGTIGTWPTVEDDGYNYDGVEDDPIYESERTHFFSNHSSTLVLGPYLLISSSSSLKITYSNTY